MLRKILARALATAIAQSKAQIVAELNAAVIAAGAELSTDICGSIEDADFGAIANLEKPKLVSGINQAIGNFCARMTTRIPLGIDAIVKELRS